MKEATDDFLVAILSDTHGLLRPEVLAACTGVDHILHAGDVGDASILDRLATLAPVTAIRGNIDHTGPCSMLPATEMVSLHGTTVYMLHSLADLDLRPQSAGINVVVSGHSHKASETRSDGVLYLNPGSVGPRRFRLPISMAFLTIGQAGLQVEHKVFSV